MHPNQQIKEEILASIEAAQSILSDAAQLASELGGWADQSRAIEKTYDGIKDLWRLIQQSPPPKI
jgi:hypothetical protein